MEQQEIQTLRALMEYEAARTEPPESFPHLPDVPAGRYTDPRFFELEQAEIFKKSWLFAAHLDEIPEPGCYMKWEQAGEPVVLVHTEQGEVKAFYNVCSHRGAPVVTEPKGKRLRLTCKYHGWSYSLNGELKAIKDPEDFRDLDFSCRSLADIRCETFGKFIFVNFDPDAVSLLDWLGPIADEWREFQFDQCRLSARHSFDLECNWKIAMEAFIESYHAIQTHPQILSFPGGDNSQYDVFGDHLSRTITAQGIPNPGQADRYSVQESVEAMTGPGGFERAQELTGLDADTITSRQAIGAVRRDEFAAFMSPEMLATVTDAETMDSILYLVFPNFAPWGGFQSQITYRYRPDGMNPDGCIMDIYLLDGFAADQPRPADAKTIRLDYDQKYADADGLGLLGALFDQDAGNLPEVQRGLMASKSRKAITASYQELRIRHFHETLAKYLACLLYTSPSPRDQRGSRMPSSA